MAATKREMQGFSSSNYGSSWGNSYGSSYDSSYDYSDSNYDSGSGSSSNSEPRGNLALAILIPAVILGLILLFSFCACVCCRPRNEDLLRFQNEMIDPLRKIDTSKIRHWVYIVNNIPGSISANGTALNSWGQPSTMIVHQPQMTMMGPPPM